MKQLKERGHKDAPPPMATDGKGAYREAMVETWGDVPPYSGTGRPPTEKQPNADWHYLQVVKHREGGQVVKVEVELIYGDETTLEMVGAHTSYVERTNLTSRQMNGRLVRKTLSFSKELGMLEASSVWEDAVYNLTRPVRTLRIEVSDPESAATDLDQAGLNQTEFNQIESGEIETNQAEINQTGFDKVESQQTEFKQVEIKKQKRRYQQRSPAMAAGLTDHIWTIKELLMTVVAPTQSTRGG